MCRDDVKSEAQDLGFRYVRGADGNPVVFNMETLCSLVGGAEARLACTALLGQRKLRKRVCHRVQDHRPLGCAYGHQMAEKEDEGEAGERCWRHMCGSPGAPLWQLAG